MMFVYLTLSISELLSSIIVVFSICEEETVVVCTKHDSTVHIGRQLPIEMSNTNPSLHLSCTRTLLYAHRMNCGEQFDTSNLTPTLRLLQTFAENIKLV